MLRLALIVLSMSLVAASGSGVTMDGASISPYFDPFNVIYFGDVQKLTEPNDVCTTYGNRCGEFWYVRGLQNETLVNSISDVIRTAAEENLELVIFPGDLVTGAGVDDGSEPTAFVKAEYDSFQGKIGDRLAGADIPYIGCKGNHDIHGDGVDGYAATFGAAWITAMEAIPKVLDADVYADGDAHYIAWNCGRSTCVGLAMPDNTWRKSGLTANPCDDVGLMAWVAGIDTSYPGSYWFTTEHYENTTGNCALDETTTAVWISHNSGHDTSTKWITFDKTTYDPGIDLEFNYQNTFTNQGAFYMGRFRPAQGEVDLVVWSASNGFWESWDVGHKWSATTKPIYIDETFLGIEANLRSGEVTYDYIRGPLLEPGGGWLDDAACLAAYAQGEFTNRNMCTGADPNTPYPWFHAGGDPADSAPVAAIGDRTLGVPDGSKARDTAWCTDPTTWAADPNDDVSGEEIMWSDNPGEGGMDAPEALVRPDGFLFAFWAETRRITEHESTANFIQYGQNLGAAELYMIYDPTDEEWDFRVQDATENVTISDLGYPANGDPVHIAWAWGKNAWGAGGTGGNNIPYVNGVPQCTPDSDCSIEADAISQYGTNAIDDPNTVFFMMEGVYGCLNDWILLDLGEVDPNGAAELREYVEWIKVCGTDDTATEATRGSSYGTPSAVLGPNGEVACSN